MGHFLRVCPVISIHHFSTHTYLHQSLTHHTKNTIRFESLKEKRDSNGSNGNCESRSHRTRRTGRVDLLLTSIGGHSGWIHGILSEHGGLCRRFGHHCVHSGSGDGRRGDDATIGGRSWLNSTGNPGGFVKASTGSWLGRVGIFPVLGRSIGGCGGGFDFIVRVDLGIDHLSGRSGGIGIDAPDAGTLFADQITAAGLRSGRIGGTAVLSTIAGAGAEGGGGDEDGGFGGGDLADGLAGLECITDETLTARFGSARLGDTALDGLFALCGTLR
mmetsp:Transcript_37851/g.83132  ORF Transcript_37851/g.83132 Transcript_37851/m.83132 type:complete len:273 (+) Transcript_37851:279-1097(+)